MRFAPAQRRRPVREAVVPMINVVFLLLIFFLMSAVIAAPPPLDVTLPGSPQGAGQAGAGALTIGADGTLAFGDLRGDAALSAAVAASGGDAVELRADAGLEATRLARILAQLAAAGVEETRLLTVAR